MGLVLIAGLCITAVTFSEAPELPRSAPAAASGTPYRQPRIQPRPRLQTRRRPRPRRHRRITTPTNAKLPKGPARPSPASCSWPARFPTAASTSPRSCCSALSTRPFGSVPPRLAQAGSALPGPSRCLSRPGERWRPAGEVPDSRVTKRVDLALTTPARSIELRYRLAGSPYAAPPRRPAALTLGPLVEGVPLIQTLQ